MGIIVINPQEKQNEIFNIEQQIDDYKSFKEPLRFKFLSLNTSISNINGATSSLQSQVNTTNDKIFTDALGRITKTPSTGTTAGLYLGSANLGYYNGTAWKANWARRYSSSYGPIQINAVAAQNENMIFAGTIGSGSGVQSGPNSFFI